MYSHWKLSYSNCYVRKYQKGTTDNPKWRFNSVLPLNYSTPYILFLPYSWFSGKWVPQIVVTFQILRHFPLRVVRVNTDYNSLTWIKMNEVDFGGIPWLFTTIWIDRTRRFRTRKSLPLAEVCKFCSTSSWLRYVYWNPAILEYPQESSIHVIAAFRLKKPIAR